MNNQTLIRCWDSGNGQVSKVTCDVFYSTFSNIGTGLSTGSCSDIDNIKISDIGINQFLLSSINDIEIVGTVG